MQHASARLNDQLMPSDVDIPLTPEPRLVNPN